VTGPAETGFALDEFQRRAIGHLDSGRSVLVSAPTGSGKTVVADHAVDTALSGGRRAFYTVGPSTPPPSRPCPIRSTGTFAAGSDRNGWVC